MIIFYRTAVVFVCLLMGSCTAYHHPTESKAKVAACRASCKQRFNACQLTCRNSCGQCTAYAAQSSSESYLYYKHEQYVKGGIIARDLKSYRDPLQCRKATCSCVADYYVCSQSCGGVVRSQLQVAPVC